MFSHLVPYINYRIISQDQRQTLNQNVTSVLTHGEQPLRANLRGEVGEALREVCGRRGITLAHVEVIGIIWSHTHTSIIITIGRSFILRLVFICMSLAWCPMLLCQCF